MIGKDTRLSGYMLESALQAGIVSAGADVMLVGPLPTPGIAFITSSMRADAGVVISASHNPVPGQRHQDLRRRRLQAARRGRGRDRAAAWRRSPAPRRRARRARRIGKADAHRRRASAATSSSCKHAFPNELTLDGMQDRRRLRQRRRLPRRAAGVRGAGRRGDRDRRLARRPEHQRRLRRAAPRDDGGGGAAHGRRSSASRSTATPTA